MPPAQASEGQNNPYVILYQRSFLAIILLGHTSICFGELSVIRQLLLPIRPICSVREWMTSEILGTASGIGFRINEVAANLAG